MMMTVSVRFGFVIVNPAIRGKGYGKELLQLGIGYVKEHLSAKRIDLGVFENNESARYCYEAVGFTEYAKRECEMPIGTWKCTDMEMFIEKSLETERLILRRWEESDGEIYTNTPAIPMWDRLRDGLSYECRNSREL